MVALVTTLVAAVAAWLVLPKYIDLVERGGVVRPNYLGRPVPVAGTGIAFVYSAALMLVAAVERWRPRNAPPAADLGADLPAVVSAFLVVALAMSLAGLADDVFGDRTARGLRGHFGHLRRGVLTTGAVKALFGLVTGVAASAYVSPGAAEGVVNAALIPLSANAVNLLDVRPGRAGKGFFLLVSVLWAVSPRGNVWVLVGPLLAVVAVYMPYDLRARAMLGDGGANLLGGVAGLAAAVALPPMGRIVMLALLAMLHVYAERASLTTLIERAGPWRWLDRLGRDEGGGIEPANPRDTRPEGGVG